MPVSTARPKERGAFRTDIQALRALAVVAVVVYHLRPTWLSGGYVGVDVFFVISGFLITAHLVREYQSAGRISLAGFYTRRARRLLPAALTVLSFTVVGTLAWLPDSSVALNLREIVASTLYVENWVLASDSVDYLRADAAPSLVQHFWTLSVEEQFYILWPLLIIGGAWIVRRLGIPASRHTWGVAFALVVVGSLAISIVTTAQQPVSAYFLTPGRAWEFALGGLVAVYGADVTRGLHTDSKLRYAASWLGVMAIIASAVLFDAETPFPGSAALIPVGGAALVILASVGHGRWSPTRVGGLRPIQYIGGISYSVYLWHWPLIVLFPLIFGHVPSLWEIVGLAVATVALAALSKKYVEDPFLGRSLSRQRSRVALGAIAAVMALIVAVSAGQVIALQNRATAVNDKRVELEASSCFGAEALDSSECGDPRIAPDELDTAFAATDYADTTLDDCGRGQTVGDIGDSIECSFGDASASATVLVIGDSHAGHWLPALQEIGAQRNWKIVSLLRSSCPFTSVTPSERGVFQQACEDWKALVMTRAEAINPDMIVVASLAPYGYEVAQFQPGGLEDMESGYVENLTRLAGSTESIAVIKDTPYMEMSIPQCLGENESQPSLCDLSRHDALESHADPLWSAAAKVPGIGRVDMTDALCDSETCYSVTGSVVVYRDRHHFSASFARSLAERLLDRLHALEIAVP